MNESQGTLGTQPAHPHLGMRGKRRSLKDTCLILAWVTAYAAVLVIFRFAGAIENLRAGKNQGRPEGGSRENSLPDQ
jgi:hypothetical protein